MDDRKQAEILALIQGALANPDDLTGVTLPDGSELDVQKRPEEGVSLRIRAPAEGGGFSESTLWEAAPTRPYNYPANLPFLPDLPVSVTVVPSQEGVSMRWSGVENPQSVVAQLVAASTENGWVPEESPASLDAVPVEMLALKRSERQRILMTVPAGRQAIVSLLESTV